MNSRNLIRIAGMKEDQGIVCVNRVVVAVFGCKNLIENPRGSFAVSA